MHGVPVSFLAAIAIPDAGQCSRFMAPILAIAAVAFVIRRMDFIIDRLFPHWEWERKLGWLNLRAQHRADAFLRGLGYFIYAILGVALLGIVWVAQGLPPVQQWDDPMILSQLLLRIPVLLASLGFWLLYLGFELIPKLRGQYEEEELQKYREEQAVLERELEMKSGPRLKSPLSKTRLNSPESPSRNRRL
jgi:hypothetical protein